MTGAPKTVKINLQAIAADADEIADATERLDEVVVRLRDWADPRLSLPELPKLRERLRDWATDLKRVSEEIWTAADAISDDIRQALDDDADDDAGGAA